MPVDSADTCRAGRESRGDAGVAGLERSLAGNVTDSAASIDAVSAALDTFSASQTDALGEIGETLAGLEAGVAGAVGWMGSYNASAACTTASCSIIIYGRGFVSLPNAPAALAGMYTVTVAVDEAGSSATMPCAVDEVRSNWIRCTITEFQGPPSRCVHVHFWPALWAPSRTLRPSPRRPHVERCALLEDRLDRAITDALCPMCSLSDVVHPKISTSSGHSGSRPR